MLISVRRTGQVICVQANIQQMCNSVFVHTVFKAIFATTRYFPILFFSLNEPQEQVEGLKKGTGSPRVVWSISEAAPRMIRSPKAPGSTVLL